MTRTQRNALAELILGAFREPETAAVLRELKRLLDVDAPMTVPTAAAARLRAAGFVVDANAAAVRLAPSWMPARRQLDERLERALVAVANIESAPSAGVPPTAVGDAGVEAAELAACLRRAAALFDARLYFEVHEELEALWRRAGGETRTVVQGLLQIAVALHHAEAGNLGGMRRLLAAGRAKIAPHAPTWNGVAIAALLDDVSKRATSSDRKSVV